MIITVFLASLLGAMALGMPIAFALMVCGIALMLQMNMFDAQLIAQNTIDGADNFVLMAVPSSRPAPSTCDARRRGQGRSARAARRAWP